MDINQLEVLVTSSEQSFSRAAQTLNRTQPAVSQAIAGELGWEPLFDRSSKDGT